ncbi:nitroreductase [Hoeflea alexandrii]|uniref:nitroreductase n=1 Tax=Hoeflea alexandrii TaxID=288436 RepID=UPI0022AE62D0|nr:nitroreductase [Hoeflea alexandrii]MCZ4291571.1 nitroreductase [Hoeflea alexandrii]
MNLDAPQSSTPDETLEALLALRHSCRGFKSEPVANATIWRILKLAQLTASWCNTQPWNVTVISGQAMRTLRADLVDHVRNSEPSPDIAFPEKYTGIYAERRKDCGLRLYGTVGISREDRAGADRQRLENYRMFGAPHVALITTDRQLGTYGVMDCGAYVANFILAAQSLGVASVPQASLATAAEFFRSRFAWPDDRAFVCGVSFGYEEEAHIANQFRVPRAALEDSASIVE